MGNVMKSLDDNSVAKDTLIMCADSCIICAGASSSEEVVSE